MPLLRRMSRHFWVWGWIGLLLFTACKPASPPPAQVRDQALDDLTTVTTAAEEADALERVVANTNRLEFRAFDADDNRFQLSRTDFENLVYIRMRADGQVVKHTMIDPKNVLILVRK